MRNEEFGGFTQQQQWASNPILEQSRNPASKGNQKPNSSDDEFYDVDVIDDSNEEAKQQHPSMPIITRHSVGRIATLGDLYDAHQDKFCKAKLLPKIPRTLVLSNKIDNTYIRIIEGNTFKDKSLFANIENELALSIFADLVMPVGEFSFLVDEITQNPHEIRASLLYVHNTETHQLKIKELVGHIDVEKIKNVPNATHFVTEIDYAITLPITFTIQKQENENTECLQHRIYNYLSKLKNYFIYGSSIPIDDEQSEFVHLKIYSQNSKNKDDKPVTLPYSNRTTLEAFKEIEEVIGKNGNFEAVINDKHEAYVFFCTWNEVETNEGGELFFFKQLIEEGKTCIFVDQESCYPVKYPNECRICHFSNGNLENDDLMKRYEYNIKVCYATSSKKVACNKPENSVQLNIHCPKIGCKESNHFWYCSDCLQCLEYYDKFFYCSCGKAPGFTFEFKCSDPEHGETFVTFEKNILLDIMSKLQPKRNVYILVLGHSGVGKSTFMNAFANYLSFSSLNEAQESEPVCLVATAFKNYKHEEEIFSNVDTRIRPFLQANGLMSLNKSYEEYLKMDIKNKRLTAEQKVALQALLQSMNHASSLY
uniref:G domain-containing protein n=1 Tax=Acrobeloides nanus TaxID=290746 RepID=A0A914CCS1_9BILA